MLMKALLFNDRKRMKTFCWSGINRGKIFIDSSGWKTKVQR